VGHSRHGKERQSPLNPNCGHHNQSLRLTTSRRNHWQTSSAFSYPDGDFGPTRLAEIMTF
jgi:hypothetical protein